MNGLRYDNVIPSHEIGFRVSGPRVWVQFGASGRVFIVSPPSLSVVRARRVYPQLQNLIREVERRQGQLQSGRDEFADGMMPFWGLRNSSGAFLSKRKAN